MGGRDLDFWTIGNSSGAVETCTRWTGSTYIGEGADIVLCGCARVTRGGFKLDWPGDVIQCSSKAGKRLDAEVNDSKFSS